MSKPRTYEGLAVPLAPQSQNEFCDWASNGTVVHCRGIDCGDCIFYPTNLAAFTRWQADQGAEGVNDA